MSRAVPGQKTDQGSNQPYAAHTIPEPTTWQTRSIPEVITAGDQFQNGEPSPITMPGTYRCKLVQRKKGRLFRDGPSALSTISRSVFRSLLDHQTLSVDLIASGNPHHVHTGGDLSVKINYLAYEPALYS